MNSSESAIYLNTETLNMKSEITQKVLKAAAGGIFLYKTPNQAYQLLKDKVLLKLDWAKYQKTKPSLKKTVAFSDKGNSNSDTDKIMARMDAMTLKMDAQYQELLRDVAVYYHLAISTFPVKIVIKSSAFILEYLLQPPISTVDAEERRQGTRDVGYGIRDTWVDSAEAVPEIAPMTMGEVNTRVTELAELHEHDTQDLYALLEDAQDSRSRISQRVDMDSQRVDLLMGDRMTLQETVWMVEEEAYASREAWAHSIGLSQVTHQELQTHRDHVYAHETHLQAHQTQLQLQGTLIQTQHQVHETRFQMQQAELAALRETDRRRQDQMVETLRVIRDMRREMSDMQAELLALRGQQRRARQPGPEARIPDHQDASGDADSHI
ncbi:hypothetical protein Tco_0728129 [Tanacetum coccineum]|uniref:Uncharacterized protein n=1 Tax=Tanacetum coccineum TaxID=301880 RepID=A0ABQ4YNF9_9ASTR